MITAKQAAFLSTPSRGLFIGIVAFALAFELLMVLVVGTVA